MAVAVETLRSVPLFADLDNRALERLARVFRERVFPPQATVTREGSSGAGFFVIAEGEATVSVGGRERARLGAGDYFGEIALIDEGVRSATITAATRLRCYGLTAWDFRPFVEEHPEIAWALLRALARRLRAVEAAKET